ncbi:hypothetical protein [Consotaella aegiceratis]|uniref:hypothetical protein n=1 Tax=Consotaella aegiceratis TaxID=3097961 RepID=UPI003D80195B
MTNDLRERAMSCGPEWLARPGQRAQNGACGNLQQRVQFDAPAIVETGIDLPFHMAFRLRQGGRDQPFDDSWSGSGDGATTQFLQEEIGEGDAAHSA